MRFPKNVTPRSLKLQQLYVTQRFPEFQCTWEKEEVIWRGRLQPREVSPLYRVMIRYSLRSLPTVTVVSPALVPGAPHLYADGSLCLYWPQEWQWQADQFVALTVIPWAGLWLLYYELWLDTGEWLGPSSHDQPRLDKGEVVS